MFINMDITKDLKDYNVFDSLDDDGEDFTNLKNC